MPVTFRKYTPNDYKQCEVLVSQAWNFDTEFQPQALADVAKKMYTKGSEVESTYRYVAEANGKIVGFIFGLNEFHQMRRIHLGLTITVLWNLFKVKTSTPTTKTLLNAVAEHEKNKSQLLNKRRSEIVLFVVDSAYQGQGIGKQLWHGFLKNCREASVEKIVVETNQLGAATFYEKLGFQHLADFDSPLHKFATPNGQACLYEYHCK